MLTVVNNVKGTYHVNMYDACPSLQCLDEMPVVWKDCSQLFGNQGQIVVPFSNFLLNRSVVVSIWHKTSEQSVIVVNGAFQFDHFLHLVRLVICCDCCPMASWNRVSFLQRQYVATELEAQGGEDCEVE